MVNPERRPSVHTLAALIETMVQRLHPGKLFAEGGDVLDGGISVARVGTTYNVRPPVVHVTDADARVDVTFYSDDADAIWALESALAGSSVAGFDTIYCEGTESLRMDGKGGSDGAYVILSIVGNFRREFG